MVKTGKELAKDFLSKYKEHNGIDSSIIGNSDFGINQYDDMIIVYVLKRKICCAFRNDSKTFNVAVNLRIVKPVSMKLFQKINVVSSRYACKIYLDSSNSLTITDHTVSDDGDNAMYFLKSFMKAYKLIKEDFKGDIVETDSDLLEPFNQEPFNQEHSDSTESTRVFRNKHDIKIIKSFENTLSGDIISV